MTSIKEAIKNWEAKNEKSAAEAVEVSLQFQSPPIEKMDNNLSVLVKCERLYLSSNVIEKITGLNSLKCLKVLSIARNNIKGLNGIETVSETLEEVWASYNMIQKLGPVFTCKNLKVLYLNYNLIRDMSEFLKLSELPMLHDISFIENPINKHLDEDGWKNLVTTKLPKIGRLDGEFLATASEND